MTKRERKYHLKGKVVNGDCHFINCITNDILIGYWKYYPKKAIIKILFPFSNKHIGDYKVDMLQFGERTKHHPLPKYPRGAEWHNGISIVGESGRAEIILPK